MKKYIAIFVFLFGLILYAQDINWMSVEQAEVEMKKNPDKPLFIDFYTDWCGWCKKMDMSTFKEPEVVKYLNDNYIPVKFDAESKQSVTFKGKNYKYVSVKGYRKGVNSFAYFSLRGNLSYPSYAVLLSNGKLDRILAGFMTKDVLIERLQLPN